MVSEAHLDAWFAALRRKAEGKAFPFDYATAMALLDISETAHRFEIALEQIAGPSPRSHRPAIDQLTDAVKWRQGIARDALAREAANSQAKATE